MKLKFLLLTLMLASLTISVRPQSQTVPRNLVFQVNPDTTFRASDSLTIQVQVWDSLTSQTLLVSGWIKTSPGAQFSYAVNFPWKTATWAWNGRVMKVTPNGVNDTSIWCSPFFLHIRIVDKSQGCSCLSPANGSTIEVMR